MNGITITCPNCKTDIGLTESLVAPLLQEMRQQYEAKLALKEADVARREASVRDKEAAISGARTVLENEMAERLVSERERIAAEESVRARLVAVADLDQKSKEVEDLRQILRINEAKLAEAQKAQADTIRKQRELDDAQRELDLTVERRLHESLVGLQTKAKQEAEDEFKLKVLEREEQISSMQRQIEDLRRKAQQGSQQLQGEVQELDLEAMLRAKFPRDVIDPVPKGEFGGDVLQRVIGPMNQQCGSILWETKRTKNWNDNWLAKLRDDQRAARADAALLVSQTLPKDVVAFDQIDGVWVAEPRCAVPVAIALRQSLVELANARQASEGQQTKMQLVYQYLTGPRFRHRVEAIVEKFSDMQGDLERERKVMTRQWAKREEQIRGVIEATVGMYGDLQGIAGQTLQEIDGLSRHLLDSPGPKSEGGSDE